MRRTNINAVLKMAKAYLDGKVSYISFTLDFPYEMAKRYEKMQKEDADYAEMIYDELLEGGVWKADEMSEEQFKIFYQEKYDDVIQGVW